MRRWKTFPPDSPNLPTKREGTDMETTNLFPGEGLIGCFNSPVEETSGAFGAPIMVLDYGIGTEEIGIRQGNSTINIAKQDVRKLCQMLRLAAA
jgi:hypothetical protein